MLRLVYRGLEELFRAPVSREVVARRVRDPPRRLSEGELVERLRVLQERIVGVEARSDEERVWTACYLNGLRELCLRHSPDVYERYARWLGDLYTKDGVS